MNYTHEILNENGRVIAKIVGDEINDENTRLANLFTAAPDMLEMLEQIEIWLTSPGLSVDIKSQLHDLTSNVIKKAKGE